MWKNGDEMDTAVQMQMFVNIEMSDMEFRRFSEFIRERFGIHLTPIKKTMLTSRLLKRLRHLNMSRFSDYYDYLMSRQGQENEVTHMIEVVSTNKTEFFREPVHFDFLKNVVLPGLVPRKKKQVLRKINVWSAGCSSGEEPYTLAIVLAEFLGFYQEIQFSVLATDVSQRMLKTAERAVYDKEVINKIPPHQVLRYFMRGVRSETGFLRVVPELRKYVTVRYFNLMESFSTLPTKMDCIFCRNVMIYFNRDTREALVNKFYHQLKEGGYFFVGNSETIKGLNTPFKQVRPTIYIK